MNRTYILTERRTCECVLSPDDVEYLLQQHASHLRIVPTRQPNVFHLTPTRLVGVILAPSCRLVLIPKLPLRSLAALLDMEVDPATVPGLAGDWHQNGLLDLLTLQLQRLVRERLTAGLHRGYTEKKTEGAILQGRLDLQAQLHELPRRDVLHSRHDELSADILCNQLPRCTVEMLARSPVLDAGRRAALHQALVGFDGVSSITPTADGFARALADRTTVSYRPLLNLCRLLLDGMQAEVHIDGSAPAFLLDLERLFERHVTRGIELSVASSERFQMTAQPLFSFPPVRFRPDVIVREGTRVRLVVDAKWKRLRPGTVLPADFYQALAYAAALQAERVVLVYPGARNLSWSIPLPLVSPVVGIRTLCVTVSPARCRRSLRSLAVTLLHEIDGLS